MSRLLTRLRRAVEDRRAAPLELALADWALRHEADEAVALAWASCAHATADGHSCIPLDEVQTAIPGESPLYPPAQFEQALADSELIGSPGAARPLILDEGHLYLHRYWLHETRLATRLGELLGTAPAEVDVTPLSPAGQLFDYSWVADDETHWQATAAFVALRHRLAVISGGPGTGKTYTVLRLMRLLIEAAIGRGGAAPAIRLAAPTGKAAARMVESTRAGLTLMSIADAVRAHIPLEAQTLHRLIGVGGRAARPQYNRENPLPADVVIVDEASMIDLPMMARLADAIPDGGRLILLGDRFQLASVESGSVLAELCNAAGNNAFTPAQQQAAGGLLRGPIESGQGMLADHVVTLQTSHRFQSDSPIGMLAAAVNAGQAEQALQIAGAQPSSIELLDPDLGADRHGIVADALEQARWLIDAGSPAAALDQLQTRCLLCAMRRGPAGSETLNRRITEELAREQGFDPGRVWYHGRPVMVTRNDYRAGLFNGDTGICLRDASGQLRVWFRTDEGLRAFLPTTLPDHESVYAMTVHKSQGSEFAEVTLVLPPEDNQLLSRELLYTGITRARDKVRLVTRESVFAAAVGRRIQRHSGLARRLLAGAQAP